MQCIWTSAANVLRRTASSSARLAPVGFLQGSTRQRHFSTAFDKSRNATFASAAQAFVKTAIRDTSVPPSPLPIHELPQPPTLRHPASYPSTPNENRRHTPNQLARAAAQAVRLAIRNSNPNEAFLIIKSLQASVMYYGAYGGKVNHPVPDVAIDFGHVVSPRLAVHAMLHEFLRQGLAVEAGQIARQILYSRPKPKFREKTLETLNEALLKTGEQGVKTGSPAMPLQLARATFIRDLLKAPPTLQRSIRHVEDPGTRVALQLFFAAKEYQRQRGRQMFQQLIDACLLQGEIIVVCFLFALLAKQWQTRYALSSQTNEEPEKSDTIEHHGVALPSNAARKPFDSTVFNDKWAMHRILSALQPALREDVPADDSTIPPSMEEAAQALAVLAGMLGDGLIQRDHLANLIGTLVSFPSSPCIRVWAQSRDKPGKWERRDAREYFDEVLNGFVKVATRPDRSRKGFDTTVFNALLRHSLRRTQSPAQAEDILRTMQANGGKSTPDIHTCNELLRGTTLLRRNDMASKVIEVLRSRPENDEHPIMFDASLPALSAEGPPSAPAGERGRDGAVFDGKAESTAVSAVKASPGLGAADFVKSIFGETFDTSLLDVQLSDGMLRANRSTLVSYVKYQTSAGRPEVAVELVLILIPELKSADYPLGSPDSLRLGLQKHKFRKEVAVRRAIGLGPDFLVAVLNAIVKAGKTGLAERLWRLAKASELASWDMSPTSPTSRTAGASWMLPIAAYTIMLQCYRQEMKKSLNQSREAKGWGLHVADRRRKAGQNVGAFEVGRELAASVFRDIEDTQRRILDVNEKFKASGFPNAQVRLLTPDERFFNAALSIFGISPDNYTPSAKCLSPSQCRRLKRRKLERLFDSGSTGVSQDNILLSIVRAMHLVGLSVPLGYEHMIAGAHVPPPLIVSSHKRHTGRKRTFQLGTSKTRGLPVSKRLKQGTALVNGH